MKTITETDKNHTIYSMQDDTQEGKFLTFALGDEDYALPIKHVIEIIGMQKITEVPDMPNYIKGVINLRGKIIPIMDVRLRFSMIEREYDERTCTVVVTFNDTNVGLIVDSVSEVMDIPEANIDPAPKINKGVGSRYIEGMGKVGESVKIILNIEKLLYDDDIFSV